jgi:competence protein ComEA
MTGDQQRVFLTLCLGLVILFFLTHIPSPNRRASALSEEGPGAKPASAELHVELDGSVHHRGVYRVAPGMTVLEAIEKAGGVSENLSLDAGNLLEKISRNCRVNVVPEGEGKGRILVESLAPKKLKVLSIPIDVNTATTQELDTLPGIGPKTAQAILEYRETYGKFSSPEDLMNVPGIGPKKFAALRPHIVVK